MMILFLRKEEMHYSYNLQNCKIYAIKIIFQTIKQSKDSQMSLKFVNT